MARVYRHGNGRIQHRSPDGRFRHSRLSDIGITNEATRPRVCNQCEHEWQPLVTTGICPECKAQDSRVKPASEEEQAWLDELRAMPNFLDPRGRKTIDRASWLHHTLKRRGLI